MAIYLAVVLTSILIAVAIVLIGIITKGFKVSTDSRDSVYAIYAADAGAECALLWDVRGVELNSVATFATSTDYTTYGLGPAGPLNCFGVNILSPAAIPAGAAYSVTADVDAATTTFEFQFGGSGNYCARVTVAKSQNAIPGIFNTTILSRGYDTTCANINADSVERALRVSYP